MRGQYSLVLSNGHPDPDGSGRVSRLDCAQMPDLPPTYAYLNRHLVKQIIY